CGASIRETPAKTRCASHFGETVLSRARFTSKESVAHRRHIFFFNLTFFERLFTSVLPICFYKFVAVSLATVRKFCTIAERELRGQATAISVSVAGPSSSR